MEPDSDNQQKSHEDMLAHLKPEKHTKKPKREEKLPTEVIQISHQQTPPHRLLTLQKEAKPRLIIDKIVLENFKSYAGKQTIGPFHENFTSIVGPNGSGKSNLIESMLFIFGFNASWMRLNRLNQLIHNSASATNIQKASVEVFFKKVLDGKNGQVKQIMGSQFSVKRTVNNQNVSKYQFKGKQTTQAEVKYKLSQEGIDLNNNRFLILQGQVQQISQMKQKSGDRDHPGLLEYLEDIIGSNQYLDKIELATLEYNQVQQIKHQKGHMMKLCQTQLKNLSKGKQQAIKFVKKERKVYQIHNILNQVLMHHYRQDLQSQTDKLKHLEKQKDRIIQQQRQKMKKQAQRVKQIRNNKQQIENIHQNLQKEKEQLEKLNLTDKNITQEISFKSQDSVKYTRKITDLDRQLQKIVDDSQTFKAQMPTRVKELEERYQQIQAMKKQLSKYDKPQIKNKIKDLQLEIKRTQLQLNTFRQKQGILETKIKKFNEINTNNESKVEEFKRKISNEQGVLKKISIAHVQASKIFNVHKEKMQTLSKQRSSLKDTIDKLQMALKEHQNQIKDHGQFSNMFEQIMKQKIPGVIGRLGDLGSVSKEYDEVITTACNRLDNIVVRNYQAATAVLNFLKRTKLGRVSCIILDKITEFANFMKKPFQYLPKSVRLFDKIQPINDQAKVAFYFAISDTLYCQDSELGLQYSMKDQRFRRRVISKKKNGGYIIYQQNGLIIGSQPKRGGFDAKTSKKQNKTFNEQQIKDLEKKRTQLMEVLQQLDNKIRLENDNIYSVEKDLLQMKKQKQTIENNIKQYEEQIKQYTEFLRRQSQKKELTNLNASENQLKDIQLEIKRKQVSKRQLQAQLATLQNEQKKSQTNKVTQLRQKFKQKKSQYHQMEKQTEKCKAVLETTVVRVENNKKQKEDLLKKINRLQSQIVKLKQQQQMIEKRATQIFGKIAAGEQRIKQCQDLDKKLRIILEDDEKEVRESKKKIDHAKIQVENSKQQCRRIQKTITEVTEELQRKRQRYKEMISNYDFMDDLDAIDHMVIGTDGKINQSGNQSFFDTSAILNTSYEGGTKVFPLDKLLEASPFEQLGAINLQPFLLFQDKLRTMLLSQEQTLKKLEINNIMIITEYKNKYMDYKQRTQQFQQVRTKQAELKKLIDTLKEKRLTLFRQGFGIINAKLKQVYQLLTRGGDAELQLIDSLDPFSDGVNFSVRPPKKSWKEINKLSGGEKTLSSLSLIFALHYYKPTPLYFMDQIDAALDFKNVSIVAQYIKKRTKDAQFIIISLRNNMFDLADKLIGVYKVYDKTRVLVFNPGKYLAIKQKSKENKENSNHNMKMIDEGAEA